MFDLDALMKAVKNEFKVCDKCKGTNLNTLIPKLEKLDPEAKITVGCHSYCGPGRDFPFVFVNNKPIRGVDETELIEKVKESLDLVIREN